MVRVESSLFHADIITARLFTPCTTRRALKRASFGIFEGHDEIPLMPFSKSMRTAYTLDGMKLPEVYPTDSGTLYTKKQIVNRAFIP